MKLKKGKYYNECSGNFSFYTEKEKFLQHYPLAGEYHNGEWATFPITEFEHYKPNRKGGHTRNHTANKELQKLHTSKNARKALRKFLKKSIIEVVGVKLEK